jgi:hypothetical protein
MSRLPYRSDEKPRYSPCKRQGLLPPIGRLRLKGGYAAFLRVGFGPQGGEHGLRVRLPAGERGNSGLIRGKGVAVAVRDKAAPRSAEPRGRFVSGLAGAKRNRSASIGHARQRPCAGRRAAVWACLSPRDQGKACERSCRPEAINPARLDRTRPPAATSAPAIEPRAKPRSAPACGQRLGPGLRH